MAAIAPDYSAEPDARWLQATYASFTRAFGRPPANPTPEALRQTFIYQLAKAAYPNQA